MSVLGQILGMIVIVGGGLYLITLIVYIVIKLLFYIFDYDWMFPVLSIIVCIIILYILLAHIQN